MLRDLGPLVDLTVLRAGALVGVVSAAVMLIVAGITIVSGASPTPRTASPSQAVVIPGPGQIGNRSPAALDQALSRPLFSSNRRPPQPPAPPPSVDPLARFALAGTVVSVGGGAATLIDRQTNNVVTLRRGQAIEGWTLTDIAPRSIHLRHETLETVLTNAGPSAAASQR